LLPLCCKDALVKPQYPANQDNSAQALAADKSQGDGPTVE